MPSESQIPIASHARSRRFAARLRLFYGTLFGVVGTNLPFFPVWLRAIDTAGTHIMHQYHATQNEAVAVQEGQR